MAPGDVPEAREKALRGYRVLVTRPRAQADSLASALLARGATPVFYPTIAVSEPPSWSEFDAAAAHLEDYDWLVLTSPSAVRFAFAHSVDLAMRLARSPRPCVAAVGNETARALASRGVTVALVPTDQRQEGLVAAFADLGPGARVLFPQALGGRELLRDALCSRGALVDVVPVSQTTLLRLAGPAPEFDVAVFSSPSALRAFVEAHGPDALAGKVVAVIGPTTGAAATALGVAVDVVPATPSVAALAEAIATHLAPLGPRTLG